MILDTEAGRVEGATPEFAGPLADLLAERRLPGLPEPLPATVIDAHTHLDAVTERSGLSVEESLALAAAVGVTRLVQSGCDAADSLWAAELARRQPAVIATVALHPNEVARHPERLEESLAVIERLASGAAAPDTATTHPEPPRATTAGGHIRGIGETGLDYYRTTDAAGRVRQQEAFAWHIELARRYDLTLVIHERDAQADTIKLLNSNRPPSRVVMHCFSGDADHARVCAERGYWLSFPGVITYNANVHLRRALAATPDELILVETDAPYLTPVPARGRPNASYLMAHTVRFIAEQRGWDLAETCQRLSANAVAAFGGEWGVEPSPAPEPSLAAEPGRRPESSPGAPDLVEPSPASEPGRRLGVLGNG